MKPRTWRRAAVATLAIATAGIALVSSATPSSASKPLARAALVDTAGTEIGEVLFKGPGTYADRVEVEIFAPAAANLGKFHGFHIHTTGACDPAPSGTALVPFGSAGGHWNPAGASHADHRGDMPSVLITAEGEAYAEFETDRFDVLALLDAAPGDGSAVILHAGADNFGNIPAVYGPANSTTLATGDAGGRYACGVVEPAG